MPGPSGSLRSLAALLPLMLLLSACSLGWPGRGDTGPAPPDSRAPAADGGAATDGGAADGDAVPAAPRTGARAPDFSLTDLEGREVSLGDLKGKVVLVNFWATWCPPCRQEMPDLEALSREYGGDVAVVAVNLQEPQEVVQRFVSEFGLTFPILLDPDGTVTRLYAIQVVPTTFFVDPQGFVRVLWRGILSREHMDRLVAETR